MYDALMALVAKPSIFAALVSLAQHQRPYSAIIALVSQRLRFARTRGPALEAGCNAHAVPALPLLVIVHLILSALTSVPFSVPMVPASIPPPTAGPTFRALLSVPSVVRIHLARTCTLIALQGLRAHPMLLSVAPLVVVLLLRRCVRISRLSFARRVRFSVLVVLAHGLWVNVQLR